MSDIFREVDEDIRREQYKKLWDRFGAYVIGLTLQDGSLSVYILGRPDLEWVLKSVGTRLHPSGPGWRLRTAPRR